MATIRLTKEFSFEAAHALDGYDGPCREIHGHSYRLFVTVKGHPSEDPRDPKYGMVMDFGILKRIVQEEVVSTFDHALVLRGSDEGRALREQLAARFGIREAAHRLHAGLYRFPVESTPLEAVRILAGRPIIDQQVRIPDGATLSEVMSILAGATNLKPVAAGMQPEALKAALGLEGYPSIEGFVAPDTYRYGSGTSDLAVLKQAVERQKKILEDAWAKRTEGASELKSPYEALILASIVEKETGERSDRRLVSSVFNNRLKVGMPLQSDPTVIYGLGPSWSGRLAKRDLQAYTPYNTYRIEGLPPTPISSATPASIEAAVAPAETRYLYFVSRGDGTSEFTTNLRDHNRAVEHFILKRRKAPFKPISPDRPSTAPLRAR